MLVAVQKDPLKRLSFF